MGSVASLAVETDALILNRTQLARLLGVTVPTIRKAIEEGAPGVESAGGRGKSATVNAALFVQWWVERERTKVAGQKRDATSLARQDQQLDVELKQHRLSVARGEMLERTAVRSAIRYIVTTCANNLRQMPRRFGYRVISIPDMPAAVDALDEIAQEICRDLRAPDAWAGMLELGEAAEGKDAPT